MKRRLFPVAELFLVLSIVLAALIGMVVHDDNVSAPRAKRTFIEGTGMFQCDDEKPIEVDLMKGVKRSKPVKQTKLTFTLPEEAAESGTLAFMSTQCSATIYIDGKLVYSYLSDGKASPNEIFAAMPYLHLIDLNRDMGGKRVEVVRTYPSPSFYGEWAYFFYGRGAEIEGFLYSIEFEGLLFSLLLLTLAVFSIIMAIFSRERDKKQAHIAASIVSIVMMMWLLSQTHSKQMILVNPVLSSYIMQFSLFAMPLALLSFMYTHYEVNVENKGIIRLFVVASTFLLLFPIVALLDMLGLVSMVKLLFPTNLILFFLLLNLEIVACVMNHKGIRMKAFIAALGCMLASFILEQLFPVFGIYLEGPLVLHMLMFLATLILFMKVGIATIFRQRQAGCEDGTEAGDDARSTYWSTFANGLRGFHR